MVLEVGKRRWQRAHARTGPHMMYTETLTLEDAVDAIKDQIKTQKRTATRQQHAPTLAQQLSGAKARARTKSVTLSDGVHQTAQIRRLQQTKPRRKHVEMVELTLQQKIAKARELWTTRQYKIREVAMLLHAKPAEVKLWVDPHWQEKVHGSSPRFRDGSTRWQDVVNKAKKADWGQAMGRQKRP